MKIFNLSLHRSGTQSLTAFFQSHHFKVAHWPGREFAESCEEFVPNLETRKVWDLLEPSVNQHDVFSDVPYCMLYREALAAFPDAKFILVLRDRVKWVRSVRKLLKDQEMGPLAQLMYFSYSGKRSTRISDYSDKELFEIYLKHTAAVTSFMASRKVELGIFALTSSELAEQIGKFVGFSPIGKMLYRDFLAPEVKQKSGLRSMAWSLAYRLAK